MMTIWVSKISIQINQISITQKMSKEIDVHLLQLFEVKKLLGSGAYGHVWKVVHKESGEERALKKIFDAFHNDVDAQRTYREITVLHELEHTNIIKLHRVFKAKNNRDLYLLFDYMEADLHSLVGESILENMHLRYVFYQILRALKYLHSAQLIHRDLKPSNILINSECEIKVCDFGLVRSLTHEQDQPMILSEQVATRWYRSPEMLLGSKRYTKQTDVWSVGCIVAQLLIGQPIFPGESTLNQLQKILQFSGIPSKQNIDALDSEVAETFINQLNIRRRSIKQYFKDADPQILKLTLRMLEFNPQKRITIDEALENDIFEEFKTFKSKDDICFKFIIPQIDDNCRLSVEKYRQMIYCDINRRYPPIPQPQEKVFVLERKKFARSHHSVKNKKSCEIPRISNSLHKTVSKEGSFSINQAEGNDKIKRMKKQQKRTSLEQAKSPNSKINTFYKPSRKNLLANTHQNKKSSNTLTKMRSRKLLARKNNKENIYYGDR